MKINMRTIKAGAKAVMKMADANAPTIFVAIGTLLMAGAIAVTIIEAPKAKEKLAVLEEDEDISHKDYINEKARIILYHYWKTTAMAAGGIGLIFWGHKVSLGRTAAALAAYQMSKDDLKKLEDKIIQTDGEKHFNKLKDEITKDEVNANTINLDTVYNTGHGNMLCYDPIGKRYFLSDIEFIRKQAAQMNFDLVGQMKIAKKGVASFDDWCEYIGLEPLDSKVGKTNFGPAIGKDLGWRNRLIDLKLDSFLLPSGEHCLVVGFTREGGPTWDLDISDDYYSDEETDDSTDMPWR